MSIIVKVNEKEMEMIENGIIISQVEYDAKDGCVEYYVEIPIDDLTNHSLPGTLDHSYMYEDDYILRYEDMIEEQLTEDLNAVVMRSFECHLHTSEKIEKSMKLIRETIEPVMVLQGRINEFVVPLLEVQSNLQNMLATATITTLNSD